MSKVDEIKSFSEFTKINEWVSNEKSTKFLLNKMIRSIQNKSKNKIKRNQFRKEGDNNRVMKYNFLWIKDHVIFEKVVKHYQTILLKYGIVLSYHKSNTTDLDFSGGSISDMKSIPSEDKSFILYVKDLYTIRIKPPRYIYHCSPKKNRENIQKEGLIPKRWSEGNWTEQPDLYYPPTIFAILNYNDWHYNDLDIWEIDTNNISNKWWSDINFHNTNKNYEGKTIMTFDPISIKDLTLI